MTENRCLLGHAFTKRTIEPYEDYRCDICELDPKMIGVQAYDDVLCNHGMCEMCMDSMLVFPELQPALDFDPTLCEQACLHSPTPITPSTNNSLELEL